jgi:hypothetical protein
LDESADVNRLKPLEIDIERLGWICPGSGVDAAQRGGSLRAMVVSSERFETLLPRIEANVLIGSTVSTDSASGCQVGAA